MRHKPKPPAIPQARIIRDSRDAKSDQLIPRTDALAMEAAGKLIRLDMGPDYPWSFAPAKGGA